MNLQKINDLTNIAQALRNLGGADCGTLNRVVELIGKELDAAEPNAQAEELKALQASNDIKQANLNLLAGSVIEVFSAVNSTAGATQEKIHDLQMLARGLIQEEQLIGEKVSFGGEARTGKSFNGAAAIDPVAQVVDNLKNARAEVLRLIELRKLVSADDERITNEWKEACNSFSSLKDELTKVIDASLKE